MITERFNKVLVEVGRRLQEPQANVPAWFLGTSDRYSIELIAQYVNDAIRQFVVEKLLSMGDDVADMIPEMTRYNDLTLVAGAMLRPLDFLSPLGMVDDSVPPVPFRLIHGKQISIALALIDEALSGTDSEPVFYLEGSYIRSLGITDSPVVLRYIIKHIDVVPSVAVELDNKFINAPEAYVAADKTLTIANWSVAIDNGDIGKQIVFNDGVNVYDARVVAYNVPDALLVLDGWKLPVADAAIAQAMLVDHGPDVLLQDQYLFGDVVEMAVRKGLLDAKRGLIKG